jgi:hypothetical protein
MKLRIILTKYPQVPQKYYRPEQLSRYQPRLTHTPKPADLFLIAALSVSNSVYFKYTMRNVLSIAITEMTFRAAENGTTYDNTCPSTDEKYYLERPGYEWSETLQGVILGAFFWGEGKY